MKQRLLQIAWLILVAGSVIIVLRIFPEVDLGSLLPHFPILAVSLGITVGLRFTQFYLFLRGFDQKYSLSAAAAAQFYYSVSWLARYIPGKVIQYATKIKAGKKISNSTPKSVEGFLIELSASIAGVIIPIAAGSLWLTVDYPYLGAIVLLLFGTVVLLWWSILSPKGFRALWQKFVEKKLLKGTDFSESPQPTSLTKLISLGLGFAFIAGTNAFLQTLVLMDITKNLTSPAIFVIFISVIVVNALAPFVVFAPAGIGARESMLAAALFTLVPAEDLLLWLIATRIVALLGDLLYFGASAMIFYWTKSADDSTS